MSDLTHTDDTGRAQMVDVSAKPDTARRASAVGSIRMNHATLEAIRGNQLSKGDVLSVARIAGVMAAKNTATTIPLCHPVALTDTGVQFTFDDALPGIRVLAHAATTGKTGVEMEALTAAAVALLTIYDMAKAIDRGMVIEGISLRDKRGGQSGDWHRDADEPAAKS